MVSGSRRTGCSGSGRRTSRTSTSGGRSDSTSSGVRTCWSSAPQVRARQDRAGEVRGTHGSGRHVGNGAVSGPSVATARWRPTTHSCPSLRRRERRQCSGSGRSRSGSEFTVSAEKNPREYHHKAIVRRWGSPRTCLDPQRTRQFGVSAKLV